MAEETKLKVKKRKISQKDLEQVQDFVKDEFQARKNLTFRQTHERLWTEIDRQIRLEAIQPTQESGSNPDQDWHNAIEMGDLSRASEIISADVVRLMFPDRPWLQVHSDIRDRKFPDDDDKGKARAKEQKIIDTRIRAYMTQQHTDFGFKQRFKLSLKEALHHGGFVAEVSNEAMTLIHRGGGVESSIAPVWLPHSMWNAFPDPSASVLSTNLFYSGSMILRSFMKHERAIRRTDWMNTNKIPKRKNTVNGRETQDVEIIKWVGPITIPRKTVDDVFIPNVVVILANDVIVFAEPSKTPFSNIIYAGYEQQDVRDPYFTSPLVKHSPWQHLLSRSVNKFLDAVDLRTEPPIVYNENAPNADKAGGIEIAPRAQNAVTSLADVKEIKIGDPSAALDGVRLGKEEIKQGLGIDANRAGVTEEVLRLQRK